MVPDRPGDGVRHVVWDWNGTLYDDAGALIEATVEAFATVGLPPLTAERYRRLHTQPIDEFYARLLGGPVPPGTLRALHAAFDQAYTRRRPTLTLAAGALDALEQVGAARSQSLLSMYPHDRLAGLVEGFGLGAYFTRVDGQRGPDTGYKRDHLAAHLRHLGIPASGALLIGDSVDDARAAVAVGARCILYASGLHTAGILEAEGVPVVRSLGEAVTVGLAAGGPR